jgi:hypothetical protein
LAHGEDAKDHNLPLMLWFALEPLIGKDTKAGVTLMTQSKIPLVREFITRRMSEAKTQVAAQ